MESAAPETAPEAPLYAQLAAKLQRLIEKGALRPSERVPSVRAFSRQQRVSIATVLAAYRRLEDQGCIEARPQSGYYVRPQLFRAPPVPEMYEPPPKATRVNVGELVMEVQQATHYSRLVNLGLALPSAEMLPARQLIRAMAAIGRRSLNLSNRCDVPPGCLELRVQIARRALEAGCALCPDDIVTTCGCQEALQLCLRAVAGPGDLVAIESPTFFGILQIIEVMGMRAVEISTHPQEGVCLKALARALDNLPIKACVFVLSHSNPLGCCLPEPKKEQLVHLLAERQVPLIEDDIFGDLTFGSTRPRAAKAFDRHGLVLLCDSFSKTLAPGFRVGYAVPGRFKKQVSRLKYVSSAATPTLPQLAIADFLAHGGYDHHLRRMRRVYAEQCRLMTQAIGAYFPEGTKVTRPAGGQVLWVQLPPAINSLELYRRALAANITIAPGPLFSAKQRFENCLRLTFSNPWSPTIEKAVMRLGDIIGQMATDGKRGARN